MYVCIFLHLRFDCVTSRIHVYWVGWTCCRACSLWISPMNFQRFGWLFRGLIVLGVIVPGGDCSGGWLIRGWLSRGWLSGDDCLGVIVREGYCSAAHSSTKVISYFTCHLQLKWISIVLLTALPWMPKYCTAIHCSMFSRRSCLLFFSLYRHGFNIGACWFAVGLWLDLCQLFVKMYLVGIRLIPTKYIFPLSRLLHIIT